MMRGASLLKIVAMAALTLIPAQAWAQSGEAWDSLYQAAKKEGKVIVWSSRDVAVNQAVAKLFTKRFPGIELEIFKILPGPAIERLVTERKAGRPGSDIIDPNISFMPLLLDRDLAETFDYQKYGIAPSDILFDSRAVVIGHYDQPLSYNTTLVKPGELKSWDDLLDPKWSGKLLVESFAYSFGMLASTWGEDRMTSFVTKLLANKPIIVTGPTNASEALAGGQGAIAIGTYASRTEVNREAGAPVAWARFGPIPAQQVVNVVIKGAPNPNAARLWSAWWTTAEAQKEFYAVQRYGKIAGPNLSPRGEEVQKLGLEVVLEPLDIKSGLRWLDMASRQISGRK